MELKMSAADAAFRDEVRDYLDSHLTDDLREAGRLTTSAFTDRDYNIKWHRILYEKGWVAPHWPKEYGGTGWTEMQKYIWSSECARAQVPHLSPMGLRMCGPVIMKYGTPEQKDFYLPRILSGEDYWCQGYSEPGSGSDLASLKTKAVREGEHYIVNGQKIWNSGAQFADYGILVTRSDPTVPKHKGLTYFFVDMKSPGIEVRPIKQMQGFSNFNEVFLTDVRIPDANRLGDVGEGWRVAITTLMNERFVSGTRPPPNFEDVFGLARDLQLEDGPAIQDSAVREKLAQWYIETRGIELIRYRTITALSRGQQPGPENSISKLVMAVGRQQMAAFGMDLMDMGGAMSDRDLAPMRGLFQDGLLDSPSGRIAAGTDEILKNIIGERVLGLPREVRTDTDKPFNELQENKK